MPPVCEFLSSRNTTRKSTSITVAGAPLLVLVIALVTCGCRSDQCGSMIALLTSIETYRGLGKATAPVRGIPGSHWH